jgi:hypothetical protein
MWQGDYRKSWSTSLRLTSAAMLSTMAAKTSKVVETTNQPNNTNPVSSIRAIREIRGSPALVERAIQHLRPSAPSAAKSLLGTCSTNQSHQPSAPANSQEPRANS